MEKKCSGVNLRHLNLSGCKNISDKTLDSVFSPRSHSSPSQCQTSAKNFKTNSDKKGKKKHNMCCGRCVKHETHTEKLHHTNDNGVSVSQTAYTAHHQQNKYADVSKQTTSANTSSQYDDKQTKCDENVGANHKEICDKLTTLEMDANERFCRLEYLNLSGCHQLTDRALR